MIEDADTAAGGVDDSINDFASGVAAQLGVAHGAMGTGGDEEVELRDPREEFLFQDAEQQWHRHGAGTIRNHGENTAAAEIELIEAGCDEGMNVASGKKSLGQAFAHDFG